MLLALGLLIGDWANAAFPTSPRLWPIQVLTLDGLPVINAGERYTTVGLAWIMAITALIFAESRIVASTSPCPPSGRTPPATIALPDRSGDGEGAR
eukprot:gene32186-2187_t